MTLAEFERTLHRSVGRALACWAQSRLDDAHAALAKARRDYEREPDDVTFEAQRRALDDAEDATALVRELVL